MKHLEDTPWWICDPEDTNYCAYVDTDSNYFHAEPLLRHRFPNFDEMSDKEKDTELENIALEYQDIITIMLSEPDQGISDGFNKGISRSSSDFILLLNSDDWLVENSLEKQKAITLEENWSSPIVEKSKNWRS